MRNTLLLLVLLTHFYTQAQTPFAPPGSEWYHAIGANGVFHSYYAGDTTISGISCRKVVREAFTGEPWYSMGLRIRNLSTLFFYNNADTIFVYNSLYSQFTPLYVFNVSPGDTVHLPILPPEGGYVFGGGYTLSTFSFVVDSVKMVLYDTSTLKTVFTHPAYTCAQAPYVFDFGSNFSDSAGAYAERIGGVSFGFIPLCECCTNILDESYEPQGALRCYNDPGLSVHLVPGMCGIPVPSLIPAINSPAPFSIFPDPAAGFITISALPGKGSNTMVTGVSISNLLGQTLLTRSYNSEQATIDVADLPPGVYVLKINNTQVRKFVKE